MAECLSIDEIMPGPVGADTEDQQRADQLHSRCISSAFQIRRNLRNLCIDLSLISDNKYYLLLGSTSFGDYCETSLNLSKSVASRYCTVGRFIREHEAFSPGKQSITDCNNFADFQVTKMYMLATLSSSEFQALEKDNDLFSLTRKELQAKIDDLHLIQQVKESQNFSGSVGELKKGVEDFVTEHEETVSDQRQVTPGAPPEIMVWYRMILELDSIIDRMDSYFNHHSEVLFDMVVPIRFERLLNALRIDKKSCEEELYGDS